MGIDLETIEVLRRHITTMVKEGKIGAIIDAYPRRTRMPERSDPKVGIIVNGKIDLSRAWTMFVEKISYT